MARHSNSTFIFENHRVPDPFYGDRFVPFGPANGHQVVKRQNGYGFNPQA
jgi:hypothetical protein